VLPSACAALDAIAGLSLIAVEAGLSPSLLSPRASLPAWTTEQYKTVLRLIAKARHNAVRQDQVIKELGRDGGTALKSMVQYNLLAVRTQSTLARDLPDEVYYRGAVGTAAMTDAVVTMPAPGRRFAVLQMRDHGMLEPSA